MSVRPYRRAVAAVHIADYNGWEIGAGVPDEVAIRISIMPAQMGAIISTVTSRLQSHILFF